MSSSDLDRVVKYLWRQPDGLDLILQATPYDTRRDLESTLTEEVFIDHLLVKGNVKFDGFLSKLNRLASERNKIVFLEGHSGVGKTTLIRKFIYDSRNSCRINHIDCAELESAEPKGRSIFSGLNIEAFDSAIDMLKSNPLLYHTLIEAREGIKSSINEGEQGNALTSIIREYIQGLNPSDNMKNSFIFFLSVNRGVFDEKFAGDSLRELLNELPKLVSETNDYTDAWDELFKRMGTEDSFLLLFTYLEFFRTTEKARAAAAKSNTVVYDIPKVIIFDNLDAIPLDLLHKDFLKLFYNSRRAFGMICAAINRRNSGYPLVAGYNFIFALRDANNASMWEHVGPSHDGTSEWIFYRCGPEFYKEVTANRFHFFLEHVESSRGRYGTGSRNLALLKLLTEKRFYAATLVPAFNMDHRRLTKSLYKVVENFVRDEREAQSDWSGVFSITFPEIPETPINSFSVQGEIPQERFDYKAEIPDEELAGFYGAILFGAIVELKSVTFNQGYEDIANPEEDGYCLASRMLLTLILNRAGFKDSNDFFEEHKGHQRVRLDSIVNSTEGVYSEDEVIKTLVELFDVSEGETYLVSFRGLLIQDKSVSKELKKLKEYPHKWPIYAKDTELEITPAGFIFLRDLIVHYEFYSLLVGNKKPLFMYGNESDVSKSNIREFEGAILATYKHVENHAKWMRKFYVNKFQSKGAREYLSGRFAFKHTRRTARAEGPFHIERLVAAHVEYIDEYRRWMLKRADVLSLDVKRTTNDRLVDFIERYIQLLADWVEDDKKLKKYAQAVTENINKIRADVENWGLAVTPAK